MIKYLFVYGTLMQPGSDAEIARVVNRLHRIGAASVRGELYDFGDYPGAVLDPSSNTLIRGELLELTADEGLLNAFDKYEEFDPANPQHCWFVRTKATIQLPDGRSVDAWIYVYNKDPGEAPIITGGKYSRSNVS